MNWKVSMSFLREQKWQQQLPPPSLPPPGPHEPNTFEEKQSRQRGYKFEHSLLFMNAGFLATDKRRHRRNPFKTKFG
jgi:hypothetical protein